MQPLALSHFTLTTCLGAGRQATLDALASGRSGLKPCRFESVDIPTAIGEVEGLARALPPALSDFDCRNNRLAQKALAEDGFADRVADARARYGAHRVGVVLGTSTSGILSTEQGYRARETNNGALPLGFDYGGSHNTYSVGRYVGTALGLSGPSSVVSAACASSAKAFGSAARLIAADHCDAVVVGGADSLCLTTLYGFRSLQLTAEEPCRPFDAERSGISIGEAAGFALLERADADDPDTEDAILMLGYGESGDAYHMSSPHPQGLGARLAMERALDSACLAPDDIDYINLHGTATRVGDAAEDLAVVGVFGERTPCSSTKGQTGHTLGASGIAEILIAALGLRHGLMPGSPSTRQVDPELTCRYLLAPESARLDRVMSNSFGFGGSNCSVILGRARC